MSTKPFSDLSQSVKETWTDDTHAVYEVASTTFQAEMLDATYAQMAEDMRSTRAARRARAVRVRRGNIDA